MSISGSIQVNPYGDASAAWTIADIQISILLRSQHREDMVLGGTLPKTYSGHGNILRLLRDVLDAVDPERVPEDLTSLRAPKETS